jgi:acyl transferase domain-containing protein
VTGFAAHYVPWQESTFPGVLGNVIAGRIANRFDLRGTNCVTDAACASAFSALSMAANELYLGESDLVITGGVDSMNDIFMFMCFSKTPALSPTEDCRPFSDQADGTMLGEGLSMIAIKRLDDAERDGDAIYAVIRGIGSSSDGRAKSVYAPVPEGQARALRRAYEHAGYSPATVELVEAHGTGTKAGDAAEFGGLVEVFAPAAPELRQWCALGSVKSQIGHTKSTAGAAGLFKAVMSLHHGVLPPTIKVERPNPKLKIEESPFYLNTRARPWIRDGSHPRRASVSSFGFGGTNFHVAAEEYVGVGTRALRFPTLRSELLAFSSTTASELARLARTAFSETDPDGALRYVARASRESFDSSHKYRLLVVADAESAARVGMHRRCVSDRRAA